MPGDLSRTLRLQMATSRAALRAASPARDVPRREQPPIQHARRRGRATYVPHPAGLPHGRSADQAVAPALCSCRCVACAALPGGNRSDASSTRFFLPPAQGFAHVAIAFDAAQALFSLSCFRRHGARGPALVNALPNRYRLRELEATLVELSIELPESLRRYFLAVLGGDERERALREPEARRSLCSVGVGLEASERAHAVA